MSRPPRSLPRPWHTLFGVLLLVALLAMPTPAWAIDGSMGDGLEELLRPIAMAGLLLTLLGAAVTALPPVLCGGAIVALAVPGWETEKGVGGRSGRQAYTRCVLASPLIALVALVGSAAVFFPMGGGDLTRYAMWIVASLWFVILQLCLGWVARKWAFNKRLRDRFSDEGCKLQVTTARR